MGRLLFLLLIAAVVIWLLRRPERREAAPRGAATEGGALVRCAHCGVHLPRSEARQAAGLLYCGEEHARLGPR